MNVSVHHHYDLYPTLGLIAAIGVVILVCQVAKFTFWYMRMRLEDDANADVIRNLSRIVRIDDDRFGNHRPSEMGRANHKDGV